MRAEAGPGGASRLRSCQACGGNLGFSRARTSSLLPSQSSARLLASPPSPSGPCRYGQVSGALADAGGVVGILGPGPFKVRGAHFHPEPLLLLARAYAVLLQSQDSISPNPGQEIRKDPFASEDSGQARRSKADRGWDPGLVTYPSLFRDRVLTRKGALGRLSRAVDLSADSASVTITTGWRRPCVPPPWVSNSSLGDPTGERSRCFCKDAFASFTGGLRLGPELRLSQALEGRFPEASWAPGPLQVSAPA